MCNQNGTLQKAHHTLAFPTMKERYSDFSGLLWMICSEHICEFWETDSKKDKKRRNVCFE